MSKAIKTKMTKRFVLGLLLPMIVLTLVVFAGCKVKSALLFNHVKHSSYMELACTDCHVEKEGNPQSPTHAQCNTCHEIEESTPSEACLKCHQVQDPPLSKARERQGYADVKFNHAMHAMSECATCHDTSGKNDSMTVPDMDFCFSCHKKEHDRAKCSACHEYIRKQVRPRNHTGIFMKTHGDMGESGRCELCHGADSCDVCHHTQKPGSHIAGWKKDFHGKAAAQDRSNCTVCHEGAYCERCHAEKPYYHLGRNWKFDHGSTAERNSRSCLVCHERTLCLGCHRGGPGLNK